MLANSEALRAAKAPRTVRKLERPRPLRSTTEPVGKQMILDSGPFQRSASVVPDEVLQEIDAVVKHINNDNFDASVNAAILRMCNLLRAHGMHLETKFKDQLDRYFVTFRNACREERLDKTCRFQLLQIIELRAMGWRFNENITSYYKRRIEQQNSNMMESNYQCNISSVMTSPSTIANPGIVPGVVQPLATSVLGPGEITKSSGKFAKPTRIPGKNYYKDEIVIRNSDSGKVMGIKGRRVHMIEEFSDTVISFQRVSQGAKDRLVQITGSTEDSIGQAKQLIEETIRRNASPVRETPKELFGGDSCSSLNSNNSEDVVTKLAMQHSNAQKSQLVHSLSMNDASIGEYQYTVTVGRDTIKISGSKLDVVRTAKLVLEEYFVGDSKRSKHEREMEDLQEDAYGINDQQFTSGYPDYTENFRNDLIPVRQSPASSNVRTFLECNGGYRERRMSSSSSGSEEETFKGFKNVRFSEGSNALPSDYTSTDPGTPTTPNASSNPTSPCVMTVIRQPLFPDSSKEAFTMAESSPNLPALCAKVRRAKFAQNESMRDDTEVATSDSRASSPSLPKSPSASTVDTVEDVIPDKLSTELALMYPRDFLLDCANSPLSHLPPKDLTFIKHEAPYVLKKVPERFNPVAYREVDVGFNIFCTAGRGMHDDDDELV